MENKRSLGSSPEENKEPEILKENLIIPVPSPIPHLYPESSDEPEEKNKLSSHIDIIPDLIKSTKGVSEREKLKDKM